MTKTCAYCLNGKLCDLPLRPIPNNRLRDLQVLLCPVGHRTYERLTNSPVDQADNVIHFRRKVFTAMWHFSTTCTEWPKSEFVETTAVTGILCKECVAEFVVAFPGNNKRAAKSV